MELLPFHEPQLLGNHKAPVSIFPLWVWDHLSIASVVASDLTLGRLRGDVFRRIFCSFLGIAGRFWGCCAGDGVDVGAGTAATWQGAGPEKTLGHIMPGGARHARSLLRMFL